MRQFVANAAADGRLRRFTANVCMFCFVVSATIGGALIAPFVGLFCLAGSSFVIGYLLGSD